MTPLVCFGISMRPSEVARLDTVAWRQRKSRTLVILEALAQAPEWMPVTPLPRGRPKEDGEPREPTRPIKAFFANKAQRKRFQTMAKRYKAGIADVVRAAIARYVEANQALGEAQPDTVGVSRERPMAEVARLRDCSGEIAGLEWVLNYKHPDEGGMFYSTLREDTYDAIMRRLDELRFPDSSGTPC